MHWIINSILSLRDEVVYVIFGTVISVIGILLLQFILFQIVIAFKLIKIDHEYFEYKLRRDYAQAVIFIILCFLLSIEILTSWKLGYSEAGKEVYFFIPLWSGFIISGIMSIWKALSFRERRKKIIDLQIAVDQND